MSWMRCSITLTASYGLGVAVISSSSVTPELARASRERLKDMEAVILIKFVLLVSVHTPSVNETGISDASKFYCLIVLQVVVFMKKQTQR